MADRRVDVLLVGGGPASAACAAELRERGFEGSVLLAGREPDPPYDRPPCSKEFLRGAVSRESTWLHDEGWWEERAIELAVRTSVLKLDVAERRARLSDRTEVEYGQVLLATGANVRRLPVEGAQLDGIHYLRTLGNAEAIRHDAERASAAVVVGGSFLGTEIAASLRELGLDVTMLMQEEVTLERQYGHAAGAYFQRALEQHGVRVVPRADLAGFEGRGSEERVAAVLTRDGGRHAAEMVVVAAGVVPDVMLARQSGLELGEMGGVRCDARLAAADGVFAAGDVCEWDSPLHGRFARVEHWEVAAAHGRTAARNMLGEGAAHEEVPYFWSDLSDWASCEYVGVVGPDRWEDEEVRGSIDDGEFSVWYRRGGRLVAMLSVGRSGELDEARGEIAAGEG